MHHKKWLYSGIIIFIVSLLAGVLGTVWGVYDSFDALKTSEGAAGIDAVGAGIRNALLWNIFGITGAVVGIILIVIGAVKNRRQSKLENPSL